MTRRDRTELAAMLGVPESELGDYTPRFNIAPTQPYFVLKTKYENREAIPATWGLVNSWAKDASRASMCINAKAETVDKLPSFREAFEKRRCVVPADGFYEWRGPKARREPLWIHPADDALLLFAGLFEAWQSQPGEADDLHYYHDSSQSNARADSQPHAGYSRRGRRGRLDEFARARSPLAQAPSGVGAG